MLYEIPESHRHGMDKPATWEVTNNNSTIEIKIPKCTNQQNHVHRLFTECLPYAAAAAAAAAAKCILGSSFNSFASRNTTALITPVFQSEHKQKWE